MILLTAITHLALSPPMWALIGVLVGGLLTGIINYILQRLQFKHNKEMFYLENQSKEKVKDIILDLLNHRVHIDRKFKTICKRIGGYGEDEIRQMLHEVGAKKTARSDDSVEWWYLKEREQERIEKKKEKGRQQDSI
jgi:hypothetical protein